MNETEKTDNLLIAIQKMQRWRMAFFGLVILLAGIVIGASAMLMINPAKFKSPPPPPEVASERMIGDLGRFLRLTPEQAKVIMPILKEHMERMHQIRMGVRPAIMEQLRDMDEQVKPHLNEEQKHIWRRHFQQLQSEFEQGQRPKMPGKPGIRLRGRNKERPGQPMPPRDREISPTEPPMPPPADDQERPGQPLPPPIQPN